MKSVLYLGCPAAGTRGRGEAARRGRRRRWSGPTTPRYALNELQRRNMPVLLDLSRGAAALQIAREIRTQRAATLMFAVVDARRPDLTTEAVLAGMADVFARPLGGRRVANAIERELKYEARESIPAALENGDDLYGHSPAMREVMALIARAAGDARRRADPRRRGHRPSGRGARDPRAAARRAPARSSPSIARRATATSSTSSCSAAGARGRDGDGDGDVRRGSSGSAGRAGCTTRAAGRSICRTSPRRRPACRRGWRGCCATAKRSSPRRGETASFDVRPMAGVDPGFDAAVQDGRVREDLFRRLSVIRIDMPPLRNRREDIPALANYFLREICAGAARAAEDAVAIGAVAARRRCRGAATPPNCGACSIPSSPACRAGAASRSRTSSLT